MVEIASHLIYNYKTCIWRWYKNDELWQLLLIMVYLKMLVWISAYKGLHFGTPMNRLDGSWVNVVDIKFVGLCIKRCMANYVNILRSSDHENSSRSIYISSFSNASVITLTCFVYIFVANPIVYRWVGVSEQRRLK